MTTRSWQHGYDGLLPDPRDPWFHPWLAPDAAGRGPTCRCGHAGPAVPRGGGHFVGYSTPAGGLDLSGPCSKGRQPGGPEAGARTSSGLHLHGRHRGPWFTENRVMPVSLEVGFGGSLGYLVV